MRPAARLLPMNKLIDDELDFLGIEIDVPTPPSLELEIARRFGIDFRVQIVLLGPKRVGWVLALKILHQPGAIEFAAAEVAGERRQPTAPNRPPVYRIGFLPRTPAQYESGDPAMISGPNNSGRIAASIITAQPAWQLPMTHGFPSASG